MDINLEFFQGNLRDNTRLHIVKQGFKSVEEFARAHDIDKSTLSRMMNGNREPRLSTLLRISLALGVTIDELCGAQVAMPKAKKGVAVRKTVVAKPVALKPVSQAVAKKKVEAKATSKKVAIKKVALKKGATPKKAAPKGVKKGLSKKGRR